MESPRKFNDCYFYYYSTCTKGDNCVFRHEPSALGCETMCSAWQQGKCLDKRCKLRHMELRKNRKQIPCYWETQPGGCRKKHCPFMHKNPDARTDGIAPSQPAPALPYCPQAPPASSMPEPLVPTEPQPMPAGITPAVAAPAPVPLLWQQQRQVVLDSAILGVLPASADLLGGRRVLPPHPHAHAHAHESAPNPYAAMPVDPLVVNFEEESDNESAPSSTPTKTASAEDEQRIARTKSQELLLLERIQAEAAAFYSYEHAPPDNERRLVRANLNTKYERLSLDELAGKQAGRRPSLDFKVLSLDEIRARKKTETSAIVHSAPITLNLNRKRKTSTHETITTSGNKIIKVVRSNSIVYKKFEPNSLAVINQSKTEQKQNDSNESRKRTLSEQSDVYEMQENELVDNCYEFKRIKIVERTSKPRLIRNRHLSINKIGENTKEDEANLSNKTDNDSDTEVQIIGVDIADKDINIYSLSDSEIIDVEMTKIAEPIDIVDLSDDDAEDNDDVTVLDVEVELGSNVPDVVASCQKSKAENTERDLLRDIDTILDEDL